jgi:hypothetical protein
VFVCFTRRKNGRRVCFFDTRALLIGVDPYGAMSIIVSPVFASSGNGGNALVSFLASFFSVFVWFTTPILSGAAFYVILRVLVMLLDVDSLIDVVFQYLSSVDVFNFYGQNETAPN